jgi:hypothetical protein
MTLERIEHKVFASEAPLDEMGQFGSALATTKLNTKDVAEIQALPAYTKGWGSAIISENNYPAMEEMNGVLNVMSYHTGYLYQEGIPTYSATQEYSVTSWVKDLGGNKIYKSLQDNNKGHSLTDTSWWEEVFGNNVYVKKAGDTMTGYLLGVTPPTGDNSTKIATTAWVNSNINNPYFFGQYIWSEFAPSNLSWLKSGGQWNSGTGYQSFYDWILTNANANKAGFKKSTASYTDYDFVVNTSAKTFRLPNKVKGKMGEAVVGSGKVLGLTNGTKTAGLGWVNQGYLSATEGSYGTAPTTTSRTDIVTGQFGVTTNASKSGLVLDNTGLSLYFYVGETVKDASLINAGQIATTIANKMEVVEAYSNGTSWYRVYSADQTGKRWCEQGGLSSAGTHVEVTLLKKYANTDYSVHVTDINNTNHQTSGISTKTTTTIKIWNQYSVPSHWYTCGYIA